MVAAGLVGPIALTADLHQPARAWHFYAQTRFGSVMVWRLSAAAVQPALHAVRLAAAKACPGTARRRRGQDSPPCRCSAWGSWSGHVWLRPSLAGRPERAQHRPTPDSRPWRWRLARSGIPWLPWLLTLSAVLGAQSALLLLNRLLAGWHTQTESTLLRQSGWTLGLLALSLLGWALFGGASAEAAALYQLDPSWRLAAHWLLLTLGLAGLLMLLRPRISARLSLWGWRCWGCTWWGLRWLVLIQGQLAPKYGAGVYLYEIAWGPAGARHSRHLRSAAGPAGGPSRSWCTPLFPRHQGIHNFCTRGTLMDHSKRKFLRAPPSPAVPGCSSPVTATPSSRWRLASPPAARASRPGSHPWQLAGRGVPGRRAGAAPTRPSGLPTPCASAAGPCAECGLASTTSATR